MVSLLIIRLALWIPFAMVLIIWVLSQSKMYKLIEERHPNDYKKLGEPKLWKFYNPGYTALLFGAVKFPDDYELTGIILTLRVSTILFIMLPLFMVFIP